LFGDVPTGAAITRAGARAGDDIWVSGTLGDAMLALAALQGRADVGATALARLRERLEAPTPRVALGMALRGIATAAIDVSDGLTGDLGHIVARSGVGATIEMERLPRSAELAACLAGPARDVATHALLAGGDDYELCFTAAPHTRDAVLRAAQEAGTAVTAVGRVMPGAGVRVVDARGADVVAPAAYQHFASA
jgi:thiamine-monophosphate kinase